MWRWSLRARRIRRDCPGDSVMRGSVNVSVNSKLDEIHTNLKGLVKIGISHAQRECRPDARCSR